MKRRIAIAGAVAVLHSVYIDAVDDLSATTCAFNVYKHTACCANPYRQLDNVTLGECCQTCTEDNQCAGFTLLSNAADGPHHGLCLMSLGSGLKNPSPNTQGATCGTRSPLPGPSPSPSGGDVPLAFDCGVRRLALSFADRLLSGRGQQGVFEGLQLGPACKDASPPPQPPPPPPPLPNTEDKGAALVSHFVSPSGSDTAAGTAQAPWRSLTRVLTALAERPARSRPPTVVNLLPGVFHLNDTLLLTDKHAGASSTAPVVWRAAPGAEGKVTVSGSVDLSSLGWEPASDQQLRQRGVFSPVTAPVSLLLCFCLCHCHCNCLCLSVCLSVSLSLSLPLSLPLSLCAFVTATRVSLALSLLCHCHCFCHCLCLSLSLPLPLSLSLLSLRLSLYISACVSVRVSVSLR